MKTILRSKTQEVIIDTEGPVVIIGESINPTRRKKLVETLSQNNFEFAIQLAKSQIEAGADMLDVNVGYPGVDDAALLPETVKAIQEAVDVPLCIDSPNPKAIEAALKVIDGKMPDQFGERRGKIPGSHPAPGQRIRCCRDRTGHGRRWDHP